MESSGRGHRHSKPQHCPSSSSHHRGPNFLKLFCFAQFIHVYSVPYAVGKTGRQRSGS
jgi:hypothetical protein